MSAATAGPASAINTAVANRNFRIIPPRDERGAVCNAWGVGRCSRSATPMWICEQALASGATPVHSTRSRLLRRRACRTHFPLDSRKENLPEKHIHQNYAETPGRDTAPGFLLRGRGAPARGVFVRIETKETSHAVSEG